MEKAAPPPTFGAFTQSLLHRIAMNVVELLYKLLMIANIEVVVALLPEMLGLSDQTPRYSLFQRLQSIGERALLRVPTQGKWGLERPPSFQNGIEYGSLEEPTQAKTGLEWATQAAPIQRFFERGLRFATVFEFLPELVCAGAGLTCSMAACRNRRTTGFSSSL